MMLGDTSMGMINGYFGPQRLAQGRVLRAQGRSGLDHRAGQDRSTRNASTTRSPSCKDKGVEFHYGGDFTEEATRGQLRDYCAVLDFLKEFRADCIGWQYQLGLIRSLPPSDFAEGLLNSSCRPESNGSTVVCSTEADQGNALPMEMLKRLLLAHGSARVGRVPRRALGRRARRPFHLGAAELGFGRRVRVQPRSRTR